MALRIYYYYFYGIDKPLTVEADSKLAARQILLASPVPEKYLDKKIISETVSSLLAGISKKVHQGKTLIWNGTAWQPEETYNHPTAD